VDAELPRVCGEMVAEELKAIAALGYPANVALKVFEDAGAFAEAWLPADAVERAEELRPSIRWHLWVAVTQRLPTPDERVLIGQQVEELADLVGRTIEAASTDPGDDRQIAATYGERMLASYRRTADNCLFPYWKRALHPRELADLTARIEEAGAQANKAAAPLADEDLDRLYERLLGLVVEHGAPGVVRLMPNGERPSFTGRLGNTGDYCLYLVHERRAR
jgi:hypothetical protein